VANSTAAAVAHFCALEDFSTPFTTQRFTKIFRAIRLTHSKQVRPEKLFMREHMIEFMKAARVGSLLDWRAALPLALCYQQLLRGAECFDLDGSNVVRHPGFFSVQVQSSKNIPERFDFKVIVDGDHSHCVGQFITDYIVKMGIVLGDGESHFACKISSVKGVLTAVPKVKVVNSTMLAACKRLIEAVGLNSSDYASHSCKQGAALAAMEAGLSQPQIQELGRWSSASMVRRYAGGDPESRMALAEVVRI
jgi:hypothetical protein